MKTNQSPRGTAIVLLGFACMVGITVGQSTYGRIDGTITDPTSAVIRGAKVVATNQQTEVVHTLETDAAGSYNFVNLDPGVYTIAVSATGFTPAELKDVTLQAREEVPVNIQLKVGNAGETVVEVTATPVIEEGLTLSDAKTGDEVNSLALNFRATASPSPIVVATLAPGVQSDGSGNLTIAGQLPTATSFSLDGVSTQLPRYGGPTHDLFPSVEGIAEFRVNTAASSAEFAQPTDLTVISRSGTNDFHGSGFWYFQREALNSKDQISGIVPLGDANTFGVSLGGPIVLPHVYNGKNKTFFYFDYEGVRLDATSLISTNTIPLAWTTGDLSGGGSQVLDTSGNPIPGNKIPPTMLNPVSLKLIPYVFPNPTNAENSLLAPNPPNLVQPFPGTYSNDGFDGRLDQSFGPNHKVWGRVTQKTISSIGTDAALGAGGAGDASYNPLMGPFTTDSDLTNVAISYNWIIKLNLVNELRFGYTRANFTFNYPEAAEGNTIVSSAGIEGLPGPPKNGLGGIPVFYMGDILGGQTNPYGHPRVNKNRTIETADNISWIRGRHTMKFGFDFRRLNYQDNITFNLGDEYGDYYYNGNDAQAFTSFLLGRVDDAVQAQNGPDGKPYAYHYDGFAQDEWRIRRNLTMTIGLRYEVNPPFNDATHQLGNFDTHYPGGRLVIQNEETGLINPLWRVAVGSTPFITASQIGWPDTLRYTDFSNIQPRFGLTWSPGTDGKTSIRTSVGRYSVPVLGAVLYSLLGLDTSYYADYGTTFFPDAFPSGAGGVSAYPGYRRANQLHLEDPPVIQWNFSIDHDLGWAHWCGPATPVRTRTI
ncbi:MAG TPA: TonB-dependent receptor [Bryobacteraceae bacterium]